MLNHFPKGTKSGEGIFLFLQNGKVGSGSGRKMSGSATKKFTGVSLDSKKRGFNKGDSNSFQLG